MAATVSQAANALRTALGTINGLRVYEHIPDVINPPMAAVGIDEVTYHRAFGGGDAIYRYVVTVVCARTSERTAQTRLDGFVSYSGDASVRAAIEADPTLGGVVSTCIVERGGNIQPISVNEATYLAIDFTVVVHA